MEKINYHISSKMLGVIFILAISLILYYIGVSLEHSQYNFVGLLFLVAIVCFFGYQPSLGWVFFVYIFGLLFSVFSSFFVEYYSIYLIEVKAYAEPTGAGFRNAFLVVIFFCSILLSFNFSKKIFSIRFKRIKNLDFLILKFFVFMGYVLVTYMAFVVIVYGSPLTMGVDRFTYWASIAPSKYRYITSLMPIFAFAISYSREIRVLPNWCSVFWLVLAAFLLVLGGEKFSGLFLLIYFYFLPYFCVVQRRFSKRAVLAGSFLLLVSVLLVLYNYYLIYGARFLEMFGARLSLQGQMLFSLDKIAEIEFQGLDALYSHFFGWGVVGAEEKGIRYLMYLVAPHDVVSNFIEGGATFTAPFPANISHFFGLYISPIIVMLLGAVSGVMGWVLHQSLRDRSFLSSVIAVKAFFFVYVAITMGESYMLFEWKMAVYSLLILFLIFLSGFRLNEK
ncbi:hypothetical protein GPM19_05345 [Halomonas sp. ZH2S]|uniref:DUF6418 domain-containing protein n=1 Tax=Vreelandella zhuhanensis TaxID=2684210 RepID=A0A7X3GZJ1_9GAMM|nr:DUF6418 domain-containing protein [Halomonas zhuhanensis]MWJ27636.1 hypothetical protein [Halomonas zhuhanensis]